MKKIDITKLKEFENHPYQVKDDAEMEALVESIKEHGIISVHFNNKSRNFCKSRSFTCKQSSVSGDYFVFIIFKRSDNNWGENTMFLYALN